MVTPPTWTRVTPLSDRRITTYHITTLPTPSIHTTRELVQDPCEQAFVRQRLTLPGTLLRLISATIVCNILPTRPDIPRQSNARGNSASEHPKRSILWQMRPWIRKGMLVETLPRRFQSDSRHPELSAPQSRLLSPPQFSLGRFCPMAKLQSKPASIAHHRHLILTDSRQ